jgi:hypothetical protein
MTSVRRESREATEEAVLSAGVIYSECGGSRRQRSGLRRHRPLGGGGGGGRGATARVGEGGGGAWESTTTD